MAKANSSFWDKLSEYFKSPAGQVVSKQVYSFIKTYVTMVIGIILFVYDSGNPITGAVIKSALFVSLISAIRNIYKFLTEGDIKKISS